MAYIGKKPSDVFPTSFTVTNGTVEGAFTSQGIDDNADATAVTIDSSENVGIGETTPQSKLHIKTADASATAESNSAVIIEGTDATRADLQFLGDASAFQAIYFGDNSDADIGRIAYDHTGNSMRFNTNASERVRIDSAGVFMHRTTNVDPVFNNVSGISFGQNNGSALTGVGQFSCTGGVALRTNRGSDGHVMGFHSGGTQEGTVSISGSTTSYNAFSGSHWSRLTDNSKPTILKGTVIETIDEMCDWYQITFTVPATDEEEEFISKIPYALQDGQSVGDTVTYNHNGTDYEATIIKEADNKHPKCKISDTADSTRVYGVFADWDNDDDTVNDMFVTAIGTHVVRVNQDETVSAGDLIVSNGDGTAKVQDDDIIRSKTIGKVLTNIKQETYDDGSYTVPCALYCG